MEHNYYDFKRYYLYKYMIYSGALHNKHGQASRQDLVQTGPYERSRYHNNNTVFYIMITFFYESV